MVDPLTIGYGLRPQHFEAWQSEDSLPAFFEVLVDNVLFHQGGPVLARLAWFAERARLLFHGVGLNLGGTSPLSPDYLRALRALVDRFAPDVVSDHLCFTGSSVHRSYDLLPLPLNAESLARVCGRIQQVQEALARPIAIENVSRYVDYVATTMSEFEFLDEVCRRTGCSVLLDVNNLYVNACNFGFDAHQALGELSPQSVVQYHVAGHSEVEDFLHDAHDRPVKTEVWALLSEALRRFGDHPVILEHDDDEAPLEVLLDEGARGLKVLGALQPSGGAGQLLCREMSDGC